MNKQNNINEKETMAVEEVQETTELPVMELSAPKPTFEELYPNFFDENGDLFRTVVECGLRPNNSASYIKTAVIPLAIDTIFDRTCQSCYEKLSNDLSALDGIYCATVKDTLSVDISVNSDDINRFIHNANAVFATQVGRLINICRNDIKCICSISNTINIVMTNPDKMDKIKAKYNDLDVITICSPANELFIAVPWDFDPNAINEDMRMLSIFISLMSRIFQRQINLFDNMNNTRNMCPIDNSFITLSMVVPFLAWYLDDKGLFVSDDIDVSQVAMAILCSSMSESDIDYFAPFTSSILNLYTVMRNPFELALRLVEEGMLMHYIPKVNEEPTEESSK